METVMMISVALGIIWGIWDVKTKPERERLAKKREEELEERLREEDRLEAIRLEEEKKNQVGDGFYTGILIFSVIAIVIYSLFTS